MAQTLSSAFEERKRSFMEAFSREAREIRDSIAKDLPAYNALVSIHAESFEDVALRMLAEERGIAYNSIDPPLPACPKCGETERIHRKEENIFTCRSCNKTFAANYQSIVSGSKQPALVWMKILRCLLDGQGLVKTCAYCDIKPNTYYWIRSRIFWAMSLMLQDIRLYGEVQMDTTFVRMSYKGINLQVHDYPEDSIFEDEGYKPRPARHRGGSFRYADKNANSLCIFAAIDDRGHVITRFAGVGMANHRKYCERIPAKYYLPTVPKKDPCTFFNREKRSEAKTKPGEQTVMVADGEGALKRYAEQIGLPFEAHVYRRDGVQYRLPKGSRNIQRVNALHHRLKDFLRDSNFVSSKYLPGYLTLFEFIENTGATPEALEQLFRILAKPGLHKPNTFYDALFSVPDYMIDWLRDDNPLRKFPESKVLSYYLYDHIKNRADYPDTEITMQDIERETGYTAPSIRKAYREFNKAGYRELILKHYGAERKKEKNAAPKDSCRDQTFNPVVLDIYDTYMATRSLPAEKRLSLAQILEAKNKEYGTSYKRTNMLAKFKKIEESGLRPPRPELYTRDQADPMESIPPHYFDILREYEEIRRSYRQRGEKVPVRDRLLEELGKKHNLTRQSVEDCISLARTAMNKAKKMKE